MNNSYLFTSESVSEGHPDKVCDIISDSVVDDFDSTVIEINNTEFKVTIFRAQRQEIDYEFLAVSGQIIEKFNCDKSFFLAIGNQVLKVIDYSVNNKTIDTSFEVVCKSMRNRLT